MMNNANGMGTGGWLIILLVVVVVVAVIIAVVYLVRWLGAGGTGGATSQSGTHESPQDVLKRRYAAGEIGREDYEQKLRDLNS
jgi:putative membrane protein